MNLLKMLSCLFLLSVLSPTAHAQIRVLAHYELGKGTSEVTFKAGPEELIDASEHKRNLKRQGSPVFIASAPPHRAGDGALQFDGKDDRYERQGGLFAADDNFAMEAWVLAEEADHPGLHGVVANGTGGQGYVLGQFGKRWVAFIGSVGAFDIGPVQKGIWTHLAIVHDNGDAAAYFNGERVRPIALSPAVAPQFRIGNAGLPTEGFKGMIHAVRVFTFNDGAFDAEAHFLLDPRIHEARAEAAAQRTQRLRTLGDQPGITMVDAMRRPRMQKDWLIHRIDEKAEVFFQYEDGDDSARLMLSNGLVSRTFYVGDNLACISYRNLSNEAEYIRAVKPEARVQLDGTWYPVGGLAGQPERAYLIESWLHDMRADPTAFRFTGIKVGTPVERYPWTPKHNAVEAAWPPRGVRVTMQYVAPESIHPDHRHVTIDVHYEIYDGIPVIAKSFTVHNGSDKEIIVDAFEAEVLALPEGQTEGIHVESDYSFHLVNHSPEDVHASGDHSKAVDHSSPPYLAGRTTTRWQPDTEYNMWGHPTAWEDKMLGHPFRNLLISKPPVGPAQAVEPGGRFHSFNTFELLQDSGDPERRSLGVRRMYRVLAPQITEHLLQANNPSHDKKVLFPLIDSMQEVGFEHLVISFWPGLAHDNLDPAYLKHWKEVVDYARERDVIVGGYELMVASRGRGAQFNVVDPATGKPGSPFGQSVCLASAWYDTYMERMGQFIDATGVGSVNPDGPYHGCPCASTEHKHHRGLNDSQWMQWKHQVAMIHEMQRRDVYIPAPDWYFLNGQVAAPMGGREASANLPRELGLLLNRQYVYDGTWYKTAGMGVQHIGLIHTYVDDPRTTLEPLSENIDWYELNLVQVLASGSPPGARANRMYDTPEVKAMVKKWVDWFKKYRAILTSDMIHVRRPDGRDIDVMLHVNPFLKEKGIAIFFNPLDVPMTREVTLPLYYTGLEDSAMIREKEGPLKSHQLDRHGNAVLQVSLKPRGFSWFVIEEAASTRNP